ncbi:uncharacterized protein BX663DRAFT_509739 [Cokeromyces recurvatus]|uniref:uncharacterized protein n=1 Tax=Cokeromyces recurvatus TaxID=90255 RepID=UPI00222118ED|nr:uncharacterized protein BX663DRAFT_509739 [Cokeromyces recurvatus]KAI7902585.1 hypothetical protein BX663DRAFT_509739 [Cokeromyces recurvatus]
MNDSDLFDPEFDLALIEGQVNMDTATINKKDNVYDDFDDDFDLEELVEVTATVEQQHAATNKRQISFLSIDENDPEPPPPLLPDTTNCFHPFDPEQLRTWIYPINYPIRAYQLNIVRKALFQNTLVALPTGLGKTFIAAVIMYNYWRWFPNSKIIFMAPTRPLVMQQIEACFTICGLPQQDTVDITGSTTPAKRRGLWQSKRVFFATPQTVQKDLETSSCPADKICCIVVDEAHRATGNYAYSEVVRRITKKNSEFRILALSATPGSNLDAVQSVITNLHITNIQIRTEDSMDIREFSYGKQIKHVVVRLNYTEGSTGRLPRIIHDFRNKVFLPLLQDLAKRPTSVVADVDRASPFRLRSARLHFQATANNFRNEFKFAVTSLFLVAESAARAHELLCQHGVVPFVDCIESIFKEYQETLDSGKRLNKAQQAFYHHPVLNAMISNLKQDIKHNPDFVGHPKLDRLVGILLEHFSSVPEGQQSKVMIFSSFRSSVHDICHILDRHRPLIRSTFFVGQSSDKHGVKGLRQTEQQDVIQKFKKDEYNVLVSTSIGEEGLDIGEIDLIVCFDSQTSPIRMLQRMGRTGRKRRGKCILLMTESEETKFAQAKQTYEKIQQLVARGDLLKYYHPNPTVIPANYKPTLCRKKLTVGTYQPKITTTRKRKFQEETNFTSNGFLKPDAQQLFLQELGATTLSQAIERHWPIHKTIKSLSKYVPLQSRLQNTSRVGHSRRTLQFTQAVQRMEHLILHPEEKSKLSISFTQPISLSSSSRPIQQKLILPSKKNKKQKTHHVNESEDDDLTDFIENNPSAVDQFIDNQTLYLPTKRKLEDDGLDQKSNKKHDKGKSKEILPLEQVQPNEVDFFDPTTFDFPSSPSWDPILPDSVYENLENNQLNFEEINVKTIPPLSEEAGTSTYITPQQSTTTTTTIMSPNNNNHFDRAAKDIPLESKKDTNHSQLPPLPPPPPQQQQQQSQQQQMSIDMLDSIDFDDDFFSEDEALLVQAETILTSFNHPILPIYPFEKNLVEPSEEIMNVIFTAVDPPEFTKDALLLFQERQMEVQAMTGHQVAMKLLNHPLPKPLSYNSRLTTTRPKSPLQNEITADLMNNDSDDDFEFSDGIFAYLLENKLSEDGEVAVIQQEFPEFFFEKVSNDSNMQSNHKANPKSEALNNHSSSNVTNNNEVTKTEQQAVQEEEQEEIFEFNFDDSFFNEEDSQPPVEEKDEKSASSVQQQIGNQTKSSSSQHEDEYQVTHIELKNVTSSQTKDMTEEEQNNGLLDQLAKGLYSPSPLRNNRYQSSENDDSSPLIGRRRRLAKRPIIFVEQEDEDINGNKQHQAKKRLVRKINSDDDDDDDDDDSIAYISPLRIPKQGKRKVILGNNPFIDDEAERSSDGGHTTTTATDDLEERSTSMLNSFIDDHPTQQPMSNIYAQSLLQESSQQANRKHWMDKFDVNKWLQVNEEDSIVGTEESEEDLESIQDFSSDLLIQGLRQEIYTTNDNDDDFM